MSREIVTYWLYYNDDVIDAVRLPIGSTLQQVRAKAIRNHDRVHLCYPTNPATFRNRLAYSTIKIFE